jgi:hypothetical protein
MAWLTGYAHRKKITVPVANLDANLTDFPLPVKITTDADIGADCLASGYDVRFTSVDEETELSFERETFAVAAGEATGIFWVKTSLATSPATDIYVYWGKADATDASAPTSVWDGTCKGCYHLSEARNTDADGYKDSSAGAHHGQLTDADADSAQGTGIVGKCLDLNGDADYLVIPDHSDHDPAGAMTVEGWYYFDLLVWERNYKLLWHDESSVKWALHAYETKPQFWVTTASGQTKAVSPDNMSAETWYHIACVYDRTLGSERVKVYVNGVLKKSENGYDEDITAGDEGLQIGREFGGIYYDGRVDEARYYTEAKSAAWIKYVHATLTDSDNELVWGAEESDEAPPEPEPAPAPHAFLYADFVPVNAGTINAVNWSDQRFTLGIRDFRDAAHIDLPEETYSANEFPNIDDSLIDQKRLAGYGTFTGAPARRIDATYGVFEFHKGRCKTVAEVQKNVVALTVDVDYFVDFQRGRIVLSAAQLAAWTDSDVLTVDFTGWCNTADEAINKAADIFIDLVTRYLGLGIADLATDETYAAKLAATETLALMVDGNSKDLIRILERSVGAQSFQDGQGRIGLRVSPTTAPGDVVYAADRHIFSVVAEKVADSIYSAVVVKYGKNQSTGIWSTATKNISRVGYEYGKKPVLEIETALTTAANALTRAIEIAAELEKKTVTVEAQRLMLNLWPADVFYLTRERYPSASGTAANVLMRVAGIGKTLGEKRTTITAQEA